MQITPCLWFNNNAEDAAKLYTSIFKKSRITQINHYSDSAANAAKMPKGAVLTMTFELEGQEFMLLNAGPIFKINPTMSFFVSCESVNEVDLLWERLSPGGEVRMPINAYPFSKRYGWIEDRFGVSWQLNFAPGEKQKIRPCLMFAGKAKGHAEEAIKLYTSIFKNSGVKRMVHYGPEYPGPTGKVVHSVFTLNGQEFMAMDDGGSSPFEFTCGTSFAVKCDTQGEIDHVWSKLSSIPAAEQCGWLCDRFGLSWQVVPVQLKEWLDDSNRTQADRVMAEVLKMKKIDMAALARAAERG